MVLADLYHLYQGWLRKSAERDARGNWRGADAVLNAQSGSLVRFHFRVFLENLIKV
jgi:hypothetical protein